MNRIGASLEMRHEKSLEEFIPLMAQLGFNHVEIKKDNDYVYGNKGLELLDEYGFTVSYHAPYNDFNLASINEKTRQACVSQVIEMGESIQEYGGWVNVHLGKIKNNYPDKVIRKAQENSEKSLKELSGAFENMRASLCIENDNPETGVMKFGEKPSQLLHAAEAYGMKITLDTGHANRAGNLKEFSTLNCIEVLHLHDNLGDKDEHLALGDGNIDFVPLLERMKICKKWIIEVKTIEDIVKSRDYLEEKGYKFY
ncbi:sugar phosphate isomerase/epimerase [Patescibacteria group bacterium]|nr:sugar phosphate isomerase/epimerase [Patescibacteria group bacterium]